jgi:hypothetical protein
MPSSPVEYFLRAKKNVIRYETLEVTHPAFSKVYRIVRNNRNGITVTLETQEEASFDWYPLRVTAQGANDTLDTGIRVDIGDLGEEVPKEIDYAIEADSMGVRPSVIYRVYNSSDLTAPIIGPILLQVDSFALNKQGASFTAAAPYLNRTRTGSFYTLSRFPTLRGFIQ